MEYNKNGIVCTDESGRRVELSLEEITAEVNKVRVAGHALMTLEWPEHRGFDGIKEQTVLLKENAEAFKERFAGIEVYFGEIAGKHSEIFGDLMEDEITINSDPEAVANFLTMHPSGSHYNYSFIDRIWDKLYEEDEATLQEFKVLLETTLTTP